MEVNQMTMTKDEALKLALEALKQIDEAMPFPVAKLAQASIKEALAQPEQEPMAWISTGPARMIHWTSDKPAYGDDWVPLYTTPPQRMAKRIEDLETEQDCVGWFGYDTGLRLWFETNKGDDGAIPLYKRRRTHD